ncbi:UNVERIFIED_CONTAM: hypothetical protein GTU68_044743, partial [Idotea baltica]|nr:hypothetical protein [Idotea baltica]
TLETTARGYLVALARRILRKGDTFRPPPTLVEDADRLLTRLLLLLLVDQTGPACHTGRRSCFFLLRSRTFQRRRLSAPIA